MSGFLETIAATMTAAEADINGLLTPLGLPLTRWLTGEPPKPELSRGNTPWGWWDFSDLQDAEVDWADLQARQIPVPLEVGLVIGGSTPAELVDRVAKIVPAVADGLLSQSWAYDFDWLGFAAGPRDESRNTRLVGLWFQAKPYVTWEESA